MIFLKLHRLVLDPCLGRGEKKGRVLGNFAGVASFGLWGFRGFRVSRGFGGLGVLGVLGVWGRWGFFGVCGGCFACLGCRGEVSSRAEGPSQIRFCKPYQNP